MQADPDSTSDNRPNTDPGHTGEHAEDGSAPFDRMVFPRLVPDNNIADLPETIPDNAEWWYDQKRKGKRGKNRRYTGRIQRISGSAGDKIRADLAAVIRDLLEWAKQQQHEAASEKESRQDGGTDDQPQ